MCAAAKAFARHLEICSLSIDLQAYAETFDAWKRLENWHYRAAKGQYEDQGCTQPRWWNLQDHGYEGLLRDGDADLCEKGHDLVCAVVPVTRLLMPSKPQAARPASMRSSPVVETAHLHGSRDRLEGRIAARGHSGRHDEPVCPLAEDTTRYLEGADVLAQARVADVDIATANGRPFVHQFSAGLHARMVRMRNQMSFGSRLGKMRASTSAAFGVMLDPPRFEVVFDIDGDGRSDERPFQRSRSRTIRSATIRCFSPTGSTPADLRLSRRPLGSDRRRQARFRHPARQVQGKRGGDGGNRCKVHLHFPSTARAPPASSTANCSHAGRCRDKIHPGELKVLVPPSELEV